MVIKEISVSVNVFFSIQTSLTSKNAVDVPD